MNTLSEHPLVDRATGGKGGGGAIVTRYGQRLIQLYDLLAQIQQKAFDVLSDDDNVPLDSLCRPKFFSLYDFSKSFSPIRDVSPCLNK